MWREASKGAQAHNRAHAQIQLHRGNGQIIVTQSQLKPQGRQMKISKRAKRRAYRKTGGPPSIGNNCKSYEKGCIVCEAYRFYATRGRFPNTFNELLEYL
jgi:hypothetical protein